MVNAGKAKLLVKKTSVCGLIKECRNGASKPCREQTRRLPLTLRRHGRIGTVGLPW